MSPNISLPVFSASSHINELVRDKKKKGEITKKEKWVEIVVFTRK